MFIHTPQLGEGRKFCVELCTPLCHSGSFKPEPGYLCNICRGGCERKGSGDVISSDKYSGSQLGAFYSVKHRARSSSWCKSATTL